MKSVNLRNRNEHVSPAGPMGLHVVRTGFSSYGRGNTLHLSRAETTVSITTKFWTNDYVGQIKRTAKFRGDRFYGSEIYSSRFSFLCVNFYFLFFLFRQDVNSPTDHNSHRI